jgi:hypothetical protein
MKKDSEVDTVEFNKCAQVIENIKNEIINSIGI